VGGGEKRRVVGPGRVGLVKWEGESGEERRGGEKGKERGERQNGEKSQSGNERKEREGGKEGRREKVGQGGRGREEVVIVTSIGTGSTVS